MVELTDYSAEIGRLDIAANTSDGLVTIRETRSGADEDRLEIVVTNDDRTEWESMVITPDQFSMLPVAIEEGNDER